MYWWKMAPTDTLHRVRIQSNLTDDNQCLNKLEASRDWSSLILLDKIHRGAVTVENDMYLTPLTV